MTSRSTWLEGGVIDDISRVEPARFSTRRRPLSRRRGGRQRRAQGTFGPPKSGQGAGRRGARGYAFGEELGSRAKLGPYLGTNRRPTPGVLSLDASADGALLAPLKLAGNLALVPREGGGSVPAIDGQFVATLDWPRGTLALENSPFS